MSATLSDPREAILARLHVLFAQIVPPKHAFRNRLSIPEERLPAIAILDGDEAVDDSGYGRGRPANQPLVMTMRPEVYGFAKSEDDGTFGSQCNDMRSAILKAVLNDATLLGLCKDGDIRFEGYSSSFANGRSLEGEIAMAFAFVYILRPKTL